MRQLRLRNIGGLIVIDYIDMASGSNRQKLFKYLEKILKERDKFQSVVLRVIRIWARANDPQAIGQDAYPTNDGSVHNLPWSWPDKICTNGIICLLRELKQRLANNELRGVVTLSVHEEIFSYLTTHGV